MRFEQRSCFLDHLLAIGRVAPVVAVAVAANGAGVGLEVTVHRVRSLNNEEKARSPKVPYLRTVVHYLRTVVPYLRTVVHYLRTVVTYLRTEVECLGLHFSIPFAHVGIAELEHELGAPSPPSLLCERGVRGRREHEACEVHAQAHAPLEGQL